MANPSSSAYFTDVLRGLGASPSAIQGSLPFLLSWAGREGVPQSIDPYNLLGTTLPVGGSHGTNGPGVQAYPSYDAGVQATQQMLGQPNFSAIKNALLSGNPSAYQSDPNVQHEFSSWSGGGYTWPTSSAAAPALPNMVTHTIPTTGAATPDAALLYALMQQPTPQGVDLPDWTNVPVPQQSLLPLLLAASAGTTGAATGVASAPVSADRAPTFSTASGVQVDSQIASQVNDIARQFGVTPSSGYRSPEHNASVGGAPHSDHLRGDAVDFVGSPDKMHALYQWAQGKFPYVEPWGQSKNHVHISFIR